MRTKYRNLLTGSVVEQNFRSGMKFEEPDVEARAMQYLYKDGEDFAFMDMTSYEQVAIPASLLEEKAEYLKETQEYKVVLYQGRPIDLDMAISVVFKVIETEPGLKGDTVSSVTKAATLETGAVIQVPLFVNTGDKVKVDTRTNEYLSRE